MVEVIQPEQFTIAEQIRLFADAEVVLATHGAATFNIVFSKPGTTLIEIFNHARWEHAAHRLVNHLGHTHWHLFAENLSAHWDTRVDPRKLEKLLDLALEKSVFGDG